jgi:hypothetical protein
VAASCGNNNTTWAQPGQRTLDQEAEGRAQAKQRSRARGRLALGCCTQIGQVAADAPRAHRRWESRVAEALSMMMEADDEESREWVAWTLERCSMG